MWSTQLHILTQIFLIPSIFSNERPSKRRNVEVEKVNWIYQVDADQHVITFRPSSDELEVQQDYSKIVSEYEFLIKVECGSIGTFDLGKFLTSSTLSESTANWRLKFSTIEITDGPNLSEIIPSKLKILTIKSITLNKLSMSHLEFKSFANFPNLETLTLQNNMAKEISIDSKIAQLKKLRNLNLIGNRLKEVPFIDCSFAELNLNFEDNLISNFPLERFQEMFSRSKSVSVNFANNPISCDSSWIEIKSELSSLSYLMIEFKNVICNQATDAKMKNVNVAEVKNSELKAPVIPIFSSELNKVWQFDAFAVAPCAIENEEQIFPDVFKEWRFGSSKYVLQSWRNELIFKSSMVPWAAIDNEGQLIIKLHSKNNKQNNILEPSPDSDITCTVFNSFFNQTMKLDLIDPNSSLESSSTQYWPVAHLLLVFLAFLIAFLSLILMLVFLILRFCTKKGSKFCSKRRGRNPNSITDDPVTIYSMHESNRRGQSNSRISRALDESANSRISRALDESANRNVFDPPKSNESSPTFSEGASHLEWDPDQSAELYITRNNSLWNSRISEPSTPLSASFVYANRSRLGSRLESTCSEQMA